MRPAKEKIFELNQLQFLSKPVLCHGSFNLLHLGHLRLFEWAKLEVCKTKTGASKPLIVTLTADRHFVKNHGKPAFDERIRAEWIAHCQWVDYVAIVDDRTGVPAIEIIKPGVYVKGNENKSIIWEEAVVLSDNGGVVMFQPDEHILSSTKILSGEYLKELRDE